MTQLVYIACRTPFVSFLEMCREPLQNLPMPRMRFRRLRWEVLAPSSLEMLRWHSGLLPQLPHNLHSLATFQIFQSTFRSFQYTHQLSETNILQHGYIPEHSVVGGTRAFFSRNILILIHFRFLSKGKMGQRRDAKFEKPLPLVAWIKPKLLESHKAIISCLSKCREVLEIDEHVSILECLVSKDSLSFKGQHLKNSLYNLYLYHLVSPLAQRFVESEVVFASQPNLFQWFQVL